MDFICGKLKSISRRFQNAFQVFVFPEQIYLYQKKLYSFHFLGYSQEGEDRILSRFFEGKNEGFYVDVGAHHPQRFSNTYYFYLQGWRGINLDAMPGSMKIFNEIRPQDINIECAISDSHEVLTYYEFNESALNSFSNELSQERDGLKEYKITSEKQLSVQKLSDVLDKYLSSDQEIDFLTVDVEGLDLKVLKSNDWKKYRPKLVLVEDLNRPSLLNNGNATELDLFMNEQGYQLYAKTVNTLFFIRES